MCIDSSIVTKQGVENMNKFILSILLAFTLVFSVVNADITSSDVTISNVANDGSATESMTLTTDLAVTNVIVSIENALISTGGLNSIPVGRFEISPDTFNSISNDTTESVSVTVDATGVAPGTYNGDISVMYEENGTSKTTLVGLTVEVEAAAPTETNPITLPATVDFGDDLERSLEDDEDEYNVHSKTFTLTNSGNTTLTGLTYTTNLATDYDAEFTNTVQTLAAGESKEITLSFVIPEDVDAGSITDSKLTVSANGGFERSSFITGEVENYLSIDDIEVTVTHQNGDDDTEDGLDDGDTVDEPVSPGDEIEIIVFVENKNGLKVDFDSNDVKVTISNSEMDVDEDEKDGIDEDDVVEFRFTFEVDKDADEGDEDLVIEIEGEDENGAMHYLELEITFEIEELEDSVSIESVDFPSIVRCGDLMRIEVEVENIGTNNLDEAEVRIEFPQWGIIEYERDMEIDDGKSEIAVFSIQVPEDFEGSSYVDVEAFFERGEKTDDDSLDFTVNCGTSSNNDDSDDEEDIVFVPGDNTQTGNTDTTPTGGIVSVGKESFFNSTGYLVLLSVLVVILLVVIVALILMSRK